MRDELDKDLQSLFEERKGSLPEEPFLGNTLNLIKKKRRFGRAVMRGLVYALGIACCALASPFLIKGSMLLSGSLNVAVAAVDGFVNSSLGMSVAIVALLFMFTKRRRISMFV
jgi:hypothetical protein